MVRDSGHIVREGFISDYVRRAPPAHATHAAGPTSIAF